MADMATAIKGGLSREQNTNLRTEAKVDPYFVGRFGGVGGRQAGCRFEIPVLFLRHQGVADPRF